MGAGHPTGHAAATNTSLPDQSRPTRETILTDTGRVQDLGNRHRDTRDRGQRDHDHRDHEQRPCLRVRSLPWGAEELELDVVGVAEDEHRSIDLVRDG